MFLVKLHLNVVLEILLIVQFKFFKKNDCRLMPKEDSLKKLGWLIYKWLRYLSFLTFISVPIIFSFKKINLFKWLFKLENGDRWKYLFGWSWVTIKLSPAGLGLWHDWPPPPPLNVNHHLHFEYSRSRKYT